MRCANDEEVSSLSEDTAQRPRVTRDEPAHEYVIDVGGARAGFTQYVDRGVQRIFVHTVIDDAFGGRGLGSDLVRFALDDTRAGGMRIVPVCPFVAAYVARHHDWDAVIDRPTPAMLGGL